MATMRAPQHYYYRGISRQHYAAVMGGASPPMHTDGMISEWRFAEGSGTTVNDEVGSNDINLELPTTPNYTWNSKGISLAAGLIQTPSITSARTVAVLYKVTRNEGTGFTISGGSSSGSGIIGDVDVAAETNYVGVGNRVRAIRRRNSTGQAATILNRGGWVLLFRDFAANYTTALGFGGRHSTTTSRCTTFDIAWAGVWNDVLTDAERTAVYDAVRARYAKPRGIYIDYRDCPTQADAVVLWGQSNAEGRATIADLTAPEQAQTYAKTYIMAADSSPRVTPPPALLDLAVNQSANNPGTTFGPETFFARQHEDNQTRALYIAKTAQGSTYLATVAESGAANGALVWNTTELATTSLYHNALTDAYDMEQAMLTAGVGPNWRALLWMQGEQDATQADTAASYQTNLQALYDNVKTYLSSSIPIIVGRIVTGDASMTESATVRSAQAAFVAANSGSATLIDTDAYGLAADNVHYNAAGMKALGQAFYNAVSW